MEKAVLIGLISSDVTQEQAYEYLDELAFWLKLQGLNLSEISRKN